MKTTYLLKLMVCGIAMSSVCSIASLRADEPSQPPPTIQAFSQAKTCFVQTAQASVRCGPGSQFYATTTLKLGASVDVYVETSDGWSGIRPPEGSHNWIPASSVYLLPGGKSGEVSIEKTAAFIGSDTPEIDSLLFQTMLVQTQKVAILGEAYREEGEKKSLWFRIAPPQGEFRWIKTSQLGTNPVQLTQQPAPKSDTATEVVKATSTSNTSKQRNDTNDAVQPASAKQVKDATPGANTSKVVKANQIIRREIAQGELVEGEIIQGDLVEGEIIKGDIEGSVDGSVDGNIVWSDEAEQIARIEREIELEQAQIAEEQGIESDAMPAPLRRKKGSHVTAYGQDNAYWSTLNGPHGQPLRVGPISGVLGWLGFSIVDDGTASMHPTPMQPTPAQRPLGGALSRRGPYAPHSPLIESRLDRLPRPTRRYTDGSWWSHAKTQGPLFGSDSETEPPQEGDTFTSEPSRSFENVPISTVNYRRESSLESRGLGETPEKFSTPAIQDALLQLTAMVSKPTEQWNLEPFRVSAKSWIELGDTPLVRGEARLLLDRIEEFESLRTRSVSLQSPARLPPLQPAPLLNAPPMTEAVPPRVAGSGSEASGWLVSVHTSLPGQPEFALTDDAGKVLAYVRPTTGLNLRRYVQQPVTVYGAPGYIPNLAARQIVAERVVRLR